VKAAVFNEHWNTYGGGEQFAGGIAEALAAEHDVDLLAREEFDVDLVQSRLGLDLSKTTPRIVSERPHEFVRQTADYDLLVNCSFNSNAPNGARHGLYVVHFPARLDRPLTRFQQTVIEGGARLVGISDLSVEFAEGVHPLEVDGRSRWTEAEATIELFVPAGTRAPLRFTLDALHWPVGSDPRVRVALHGNVVLDQVIARESPVDVDVTVEGRGELDPVVLTVESDAFCPQDAFGVADPRELGILVRDFSLGNTRVPVPPSWRETLSRRKRPLRFLDSYDTIASNSGYTRHWVQRWWQRDSEVLYPPVKLRKRGAKEPVILGVGRFFDSHGGHSKKQLELVRAFRSLHQRTHDSWTLHLIGGCAPDGRAYLDEVRRASIGLPVRFHVNASGQDVDELFAKAGIFWHATGFGESEQRHPDRFEHFGISVVEAMSAGAVPVVFGKAGPAEIVRNGVSGVLFSTRQALVDATWELIRNPHRIESMSRHAAERAAEFGFDRFRESLHRMVERMVSARSGSERAT